MDNGVQAPKTSRRSGLLQALGPGIMYAGAAIGVSHLVQSTRAGAGYGFALVWPIFYTRIPQVLLVTGVVFQDEA